MAVTRLRAPESLMGPVDAAALDAAVRGSEAYGRYATAVDRESAYERLSAERPAEESTAQEPARRAPAPADDDESLDQQVVGSGMFTSLARSVGTQLGREITRSLFGTSRRRR